MNWLRIAMIVSLATAAISAVTLYRVKFDTQQVIDKSRSMERRIAELESSIALLAAERAALTRPERLETLATRHLTLVPLSPKQIGTVANLPWRDDAARADAEGAGADALPVPP